MTMRDRAGTSDIIPRWVMKWGGIAWRALAMGVVVFFAFQGAKRISVVVIAVVLALFLASVLWGPVQWLVDRAGWPPLAATLTVFLVALAVFAGVVFFTVPPIVASVGDLSEDLSSAADSMIEWLIDGPLGLTETQVENLRSTVTGSVTNMGSVLGGATLVVEFVTGFFLAMIVTFFILKDGRSLVSMLRARLTDRHADDVDRGLETAFGTLSRYMGGMALVGLFDATVIGIGLLVVGVPLVLPLSILVFFGAFFPLIGAFVSGLFAVAVAFVNGGVVDALIILGLITVVQQFEGDVILPLVFKEQLRLHPVVIVLAVAVGGVAFGIMGAFIAVPLVAVVIALREELGEKGEQSLLTIARG